MQFKDFMEGLYTEERLNAKDSEQDFKLKAYMNIMQVYQLVMSVPSRLKIAGHMVSTVVKYTKHLLGKYPQRTAKEVINEKYPELNKEVTTEAGQSNQDQAA